jgi:hypothetical protein
MTAQPPAPPAPALPQGEPTITTPWYRTRFGFGLGAVVAVLWVVGVLILRSPAEEPAAAPAEVPEPEPAPEPEPEPEPAMVAVPDFQGPYVAAVEAAQEAGPDLLPIDEAGERQSIFNRENWEVDAQTVAPGVSKSSLGPSRNHGVPAPQIRSVNRGKLSATRNFGSRRLWTESGALN